MCGVMNMADGKYPLQIRHHDICLGGSVSSLPILLPMRYMVCTIRGQAAIVIDVAVATSVANILNKIGVYLELKFQI